MSRDPDVEWTNPSASRYDDTREPLKQKRTENKRFRSPVAEIFSSRPQVGDLDRSSKRYKKTAVKRIVFTTCALPIAQFQTTSKNNERSVKFILGGEGEIEREGTPRQLARAPL